MILWNAIFCLYFYIQPHSTRFELCSNGSYKIADEFATIHFHDSVHCTAFVQLYIQASFVWISSTTTSPYALPAATYLPTYNIIHAHHHHHTRAYIVVMGEGFSQAENICPASLALKIMLMNDVNNVFHFQLIKHNSVLLLTHQLSYIYHQE